MHRLLAKVDSDTTATSRVKTLENEFKGFRFDAVKTGADTRSEIRLLEVKPGVNVDEATIERMKRVASGINIPAPIKVPAATVPAPVKAG